MGTPLLHWRSARIQFVKPFDGRVERHSFKQKCGPPTKGRTCKAQKPAKVTLQGGSWRILSGWAVSWSLVLYRRMARRSRKLHSSPEDQHCSEFVLPAAERGGGNFALQSRHRIGA
jgi:hypothetical protein